MLALAAALPAAAACTRATAEAKPGGRGSVTIGGTTFAVSAVKFVYQPGRNFRIDADPRRAGEDCPAGVSGGVSLYGDLPEGVNSPVELSGKEVPFQFSGDGEQRTQCAAGADGLLGVKKGTVRFGRVFGGAIGFTFSGDFKRVEAEGGDPGSTVRAFGSGTATIQ